MANKKSHPGTIEKRGSNYRVILYAGGERHSFTLGNVTREAAEEFARMKHRDLSTPVRTKKVAEILPAIEVLNVLSELLSFCEKIVGTSDGNSQSWEEYEEEARVILGRARRILTVVEPTEGRS